MSLSKEGRASLRLAETLAALRDEPRYRAATPKEQAVMEKIIQGATVSGDASIAYSFAILLGPALKAFYPTIASEMLADFMSAGFNTYKLACIMEALITLWPDASTAPDEAVMMGREAATKYARQITIYSNLADVIMASRKESA